MALDVGVFLHLYGQSCSVFDNSCVVMDERSTQTEVCLYVLVKLHPFTLLLEHVKKDLPIYLEAGNVTVK